MLLLVLGLSPAATADDERTAPGTSSAVASQADMTISVGCTTVEVTSSKDMSNVVVTFAGGTSVKFEGELGSQFTRGFDQLLASATAKSGTSTISGSAPANCTTDGALSPGASPTSASQPAPGPTPPAQPSPSPGVQQPSKASQADMTISVGCTTVKVTSSKDLSNVVVTFAGGNSVMFEGELGTQFTRSFDRLLAGATAKSGTSTVSGSAPSECTSDGGPAPSQSPTPSSEPSPEVCPAGTEMAGQPMPPGGVQGCDAKVAKGKGTKCISYYFLYTDGHVDSDDNWCGGNDIFKSSTPSLHVNSLHVSCSDTIHPDGTAEKSDLGGHLVATWWIDKGDKICGATPQDELPADVCPAGTDMAGQPIPPGGVEGCDEDPAEGKSSKCVSYYFLYTDGHIDSDDNWCGGNDIFKSSTPSLHVNSLHVSCSDTIHPDGTAEKSDLAGHLVATWWIDKGAKFCGATPQDEPLPDVCPAGTEMAGQPMPSGGIEGCNGVPGGPGSLDPNAPGGPGPDVCPAGTEMAGQPVPSGGVEGCNGVPGGIPGPFDPGVPGGPGPFDPGAPGGPRPDVCPAGTEMAGQPIPPDGVQECHGVPGGPGPFDPGPGDPFDPGVPGGPGPFDPGPGGPFDPGVPGGPFDPGPGGPFDPGPGGPFDPGPGGPFDPGVPGGPGPFDPTGPGVPGPSDGDVPGPEGPSETGELPIPEVLSIPPGQPDSSGEPTQEQEDAEVLGSRITQRPEPATGTTVSPRRQQSQAAGADLPFTGSSLGSIFGTGLLLMILGLVLVTRSAGMGRVMH
ncbi:MAG: hypothetical protein ABR505_02730 [Actinomycetota bacterium]